MRNGPWRPDGDRPTNAKADEDGKRNRGDRSAEGQVLLCSDLRIRQGIQGKGLRLPHDESQHLARGLERLGLASYADYLASDGWKLRRRQTRRRAYGLCCACGAAADLHVHHATYARLGDELAADLVLLCSGCHEATHRLAAEGVPLAVAHEEWRRRSGRTGPRVVRLPPGPRRRPGPALTPEARRERKAAKKARSRALREKAERLRREPSREVEGRWNVGGELRRQAKAPAVVVPCPTCGAAAGEPCAVLGRAAPRMPHGARKASHRAMRGGSS